MQILFTAKEHLEKKHCAPACSTENNLLGESKVNETDLALRAQLLPYDHTAPLWSNYSACIFLRYGKADDLMQESSDRHLITFGFLLPVCLDLSSKLPMNRG